MKPTCKRCFIYTRFSPRRNEDQCASCEIQETHCRMYAKQRDMKVVAAFHDKAFSGDQHDRPALWQMVEGLQKGDVVLVYRLDRLARDVFLSHVIEQAVDCKGARIESAAGEGTWGDSPSDRLTRQILQALAEYERKVISVRTSIAMRRHQENGRIMGSIVKYGFQLVPGETKKTEPCQQEQLILMRIVDMRCRFDKAFREIAEQLNEEGLLNRGGKPWTAQGTAMHFRRNKQLHPAVEDAMEQVSVEAIT